MRIARRVTTAGLALCVLILAFPGRKREEPNPVFQQINAIVKSLSEISGLAEEHPVAYGTLTKKQLRQFLNKRIKRTIRPDEIKADELALKLFGLVPADFDLKRSTLDLLTEQAAAFYDYDDKKLFLLQGSRPEEDTTTLAHELSHALADQHFDLAKFMDETPSNDDENLAHTAVVEGQASWLMIAYDLAEAGKPPVPTPEMLRSVEDSSDSSLADYPVLKSSPLYIQRSLLFPYTEGTAFFDAVFKKMGKAGFSAVFSSAPVASAQILHPERYFRHDQPDYPPLPALTLKRQGKEITQGSFGEFDHGILLRQYAGEATANALAPHLAGAQFRVSTAGRGGRALLEYASKWDGERSASEYFAAYKRILKGKWRRCDPSVDTQDLFAGVSEGGYFVTQLKGRTLVSVEGLSNAEDWSNLQGEIRKQRGPSTAGHVLSKLRL